MTSDGASIHTAVGQVAPAGDGRPLRRHGANVGDRACPGRGSPPSRPTAAAVTVPEVDTSRPGRCPTSTPSPRDLAAVETALARLDDGTYWTTSPLHRRPASPSRETRPGRRRRRRRDRARRPRRRGRRRLGRLMSWRSRRMWKMTARNATRYAGTKARQLVTPAERRAALDEQFAIRTAEDVAKELGEMKGVLMKVGQLVSFIAEGLPDEAQAALAALQADAAPMAPDARRRASCATSSATSPSGCSGAGRTCPSPRPASARSTGPRRPTAATSPSRCSSRASREAIEEDLDGAEVMYTCSRRWRSTASTPAGSSTSCGPGCARSSTTGSRRATSPSSPSTSPATRGCASPQLVPELSARAGADDRVDRRDVVGPVRRHGARRRPSSAPAR